MSKDEQFAQDVLVEPRAERSSFDRLRTSVVVAVSIGLVAATAAARQQLGGRGGGSSPGATVWTEQCAGCHGTGATAGRARNLFDEAWLNRVDDARVTNAIKNGVPDSEMPAFGASLNDQQTFN